MQYKKNIWKKWIPHLVSMPFIRAPLPIVLVLDLVIELYQQICFPLYGLPKLKRSAYFHMFDRAKLDYLNIFEKIGCVYCGYMNGFFAYYKEIVNRTEHYRCGIIHQDKNISGHEYQHEKNFAAYGDAADLHKKFPLQK